MVNCGKNDLLNLINVINPISNDIEYDLPLNYIANTARRITFYFRHKSNTFNWAIKQLKAIVINN